MKNCKTLYEAQTASRLKEIIQSLSTHPHQIKHYYVFGTKIFLRSYTEIYRHLLSVFQECGSWASRNGAVQMFFSDAKQCVGKFSSELRFVKLVR